MHPKKNIEVDEDGQSFSFIINLQSKTLELITRKPVGAQTATPIAMIDVPDKVQIKFYRALQQLANDYNASNGPK